MFGVYNELDIREVKIIFLNFIVYLIDDGLEKIYVMIFF